MSPPHCWSASHRAQPNNKSLLRVLTPLSLSLPEHPPAGGSPTAGGVCGGDRRPRRARQKLLFRDDTLCGSRQSATVCVRPAFCCQCGRGQRGRQSTGGHRQMGETRQGSTAVRSNTILTAPPARRTAPSPSKLVFCLFVFSLSSFWPSALG